MKFLLIFILFGTYSFSQKTQEFKFYSNLKDQTGQIKSLTVVDAREDSDLGSVKFKKFDYHFEFSKGSLKQEFEENFQKSNSKEKGSRNLVLYVEQFKVFSEAREKGDLDKAALKFTMFENKYGKYFFVNRLEDVVVINFEKYDNTPRGFAMNLDDILSDMVKESFKKTPSDLSVPIDEVANDELVKKQIPAFSASFVDGVYPDADSFLSQKPLVGYQLVKNKDGEVLRAKKGEERIGSQKMYAYAENGKAYKSTPFGFTEIFKDEYGLYIQSKRAILFPVYETNTAVVVGAAVGGIAGGLVAGVISGLISAKKIDKTKKVNPDQVYLDFLSGDYIFLN